MYVLMKKQCQEWFLIDFHSDITYLLNSYITMYFPYWNLTSVRIWVPSFSSLCSLFHVLCFFSFFSHFSFFSEKVKRMGLLRLRICSNNSESFFQYFKESKSDVTIIPSLPFILKYLFNTPGSGYFLNQESIVYMK